MTTIILTAVLALVLGAIVGALPTWHRMNNALIVARADRRAAQKRCAHLQARKNKDDAEYNALLAQAEQYNADADAWWEKYVAADNERNDLLELIRERGMHDDAVAAAHEAEVLVTDDLPFCREIEAAVPVSPAPAWGFTGSWRLVDTRPALAATPARIGRHRADEMAGAAA